MALAFFQPANLVENDFDDCIESTHVFHLEVQNLTRSRALKNVKRVNKFTRNLADSSENNCSNFSLELTCVIIYFGYP